MIAPGRRQRGIESTERARDRSRDRRRDGSAHWRRRHGVRAHEHHVVGNLRHFVKLPLENRTSSDEDRAFVAAAKRVAWPPASIATVALTWRFYLLTP
jgi:hypothetical protein